MLTIRDLEAWLRRSAELVGEHADELTALDAAIGDADHGANMKRGMTAVVSALDAGSFETVGTLLKKTGMTLVSTVGGASGPLYGTFFMRMGAAQASATGLDGPALAGAVEAGVAGIASRGRASAGEKTMLDAWYPALRALAADPQDLAAATAAAAAAAADGRDATTPMMATKGRASYLAERSIGHTDPGAASTALILQALAEVAREAGAGEPQLAPEAAEPGQATQASAQPTESGQPGQPGQAARAGGQAAEDAEDSGAAEDAGDPGRADMPDGSHGDAQSRQVGLVLVSHSRALAQAALEMTRRLVGSVEVTVEIAAGLPDGGLGTDGAAVARAVTAVASSSGGGVLVLTDLGSGVMSAEAGIERLTPETASRTRLSGAPFLEGLVGAYAAAGIGRDLEAVAAEASSSASAKEAQVGGRTAGV